MTPFVRSAILVAALAATAQTTNAQTRTPTPRSVAAANTAARVQPQLEAFQGAMQRFAWSEGGLYQVYTAPGRITDLVLEAGERLAGPGPIAAGDTARWVIGDTESGDGETRRVHVLIKPTLPGLATNLVINTDRRTYYVELRASATTYMASVAWTYPKDSLIAVSKPKLAVAPTSPAPAQVPVGLNLARLNFDYRISGDKVAWRPQQVFDDGAKVHVVFPAGVASGDLPPLFLIDAAGKAGLINYRLDGRQIIVDRLFEKAELRLGDRRSARKVRIERVQHP
ncbi:P-type conjugative transfer protein TrbG [uncultured Caulobacter sp.]|uniref:P-type conjugative transfer protein TrbG n=1 Tax=uncultured Caulobacter sp. TaxID=158749 RepID=UPI00260F8AFD|nr:P-type conjugative transfer protein TrbG [uncultured Caulobacter sp.]